MLMDGEHGAVTLYNYPFPASVIIASQRARNAHLESITLTGTTSNLKFRSLSVWPSDYTKVGTDTALVSAATTTSGIQMNNLDVRTDKDAANYQSWSAATWDAHKFNGISLSGINSVVRGSTVTGAYHGIIMAGANAKVFDNLVEGFNGDGMRGTGAKGLFRNNRVINCVVTDDNHDDGFQSWAPSTGSISGITLDGNTFLEWTGAPNPLSCHLQGIGLFDGFFDSFTIINNVVATTAYHGISVYGGRKMIIANNTVVNSLGTPSTTPYIAVFNHKNGTSSSDVTVANNLAMSIRGTASTENRVVFVDNTAITSPLTAFQGALAFNYRPATGSSFIDSGDSALAPVGDIEGTPRTSGGAPDRGAYEKGDAIATAVVTDPSVQATSDSTASGTTETASTASATTSTMSAKFVPAP